MSSIAERLLGFHSGPLTPTKSFRAPKSAVEAVRKLIHAIVPGDEFELSEYQIARWAIEILGSISPDDLRQLLALNVESKLNATGQIGQNGLKSNFLTTREVMKMFRIKSRQTVLNWREEGKIAGIKPGRDWLWFRSSIEVLQKNLNGLADEETITRPTVFRDD